MPQIKTRIHYSLASPPSLSLPRPRPVPVAVLLLALAPRMGALLALSVIWPLPLMLAQMRVPWPGLALICIAPRRPLIFASVA